VEILEFNSRNVFHDDLLPEKTHDEILNIYEITENIEEYYQQKAPNLWNAWVRAHNILVEQQEKIDDLNNKLNQVQQQMKEQYLKSEKSRSYIVNTIINQNKALQNTIEKMLQLSQTPKQQKNTSAQR